MTHAYEIRINGRYAGMVFAERCVLKGDTYKLWCGTGICTMFLQREAGIQVVPQPGSKAPAIETESEVA